MYAFAVGLALFAAAQIIRAVILYPPDWSGLGLDFGIYHDATVRWLAGGPWYLPHQTVGMSYDIALGDVLYPPTMLWLFVPFAVGLPAVFWWVIPIGIYLYGIAALRPGPWVCLAMALLFAFWPGSSQAIIKGNPIIWVAAAYSVAMTRPALGVMILLKPSLFPFALCGVRSRGWWIVAAILAAATVPFIGMALQYPAVVLNARDPLGWLYSYRDVPLLLIPLIARFARVTLPSRVGRYDPSELVGRQASANAAAGPFLGPST